MKVQLLVCDDSQQADSVVQVGRLIETNVSRQSVLKILQTYKIL